MPKRKQAVLEERRQQIIDGALKVFSLKGYTEATNKEVAEAAGINSPGLIYHYFANKEALLRAVIERHAPPIQWVARADALMALPPAEVLTQLGHSYLRLIEDPQFSAFIRVLLGEAIRAPRFAQLFAEIAPLRILHLLTEYLRRKMDEGLLRRADPAVAARCFMGPLVTYLMTRAVLGLEENPRADDETILTTVVAVFLHGLQVD